MTPRLLLRRHCDRTCAPCVRRHRTSSIFKLSIAFAPAWSHGGRRPSIRSVRSSLSNKASSARSASCRANPGGFTSIIAQRKCQAALGLLRPQCLGEELTLERQRRNGRSCGRRVLWRRWRARPNKMRTRILLKSHHKMVSSYDGGTLPKSAELIGQRMSWCGRAGVGRLANNRSHSG
jgi:hypothetical protein